MPVAPAGEASGSNDAGAQNSSSDLAVADTAVGDVIVNDGAENTTAEAATSLSDGASSTDLTPASADETVAPLIAEFNQGKKSNKPLKTKSLSDKQLSPRQRRRRWIRNILESYAKLKKQVGNLTPYQILMITRGCDPRLSSSTFNTIASLWYRSAAKHFVQVDIRCIAFCFN